MTRPTPPPVLRTLARPRASVARVSALALLAGCAGGYRDSPDAGAEGADAGVTQALAYVRSGARIRAHLWDGGDGAVVLRSLRDVRLDMDCRLEVAADGQTRCLPPPGHSLEDISFLDAACDEPAVRSWEGDWEGGAPPAYVRLTERDGDPYCAPERSRVLRVTGAVEAATVHGRAEGGACVSRESPAGAFYLTLADEIVPGEFVGRTAEVDETAGGAIAAFWLGEDGARVLRYPIDPVRGVRCAVWESAGGACLPTPQAMGYGGYLFAGPDCGERVAWALWEDCPRPTVVFEGGGAAAALRGGARHPGLRVHTGGAGGDL